MFGIGPSYVFMLRHRLPFCLMQSGARPWISAMATNLFIAVFFLAMIWALGIKAFLLVHLPIVAIGASLGVWLFFVQHQFEDAYWAEAQNWSFQKAALYGSSYYDLPKPLAWLTAYIGIHHIHHLYSRIPFYRLPQLLRDHPELKGLRRITLWDSLRLPRFKLWDTERRRLVTFADTKTPG
jgi:omega-6 fatty acid desaturase (delta-12 desaturase)